MLQEICALKIEMIQFTYIMDDQKMNLLLSNVVGILMPLAAFSI